MTSDDRPYEIGRGRPPLHSRFKAGQSGNPSGRPKRRRSFASDIAAELDAPASSGSDKSKQQTLAADLVNAALAGNAAAIKLITSIALALNHNDADSDTLGPQDQQLVEDFERREAPTAPTIACSHEGGDDE